MNLYLLEQEENTGYDTYDALVVAAENEEQARNIHPSGGSMIEWPGGSYTWVSKPENVKVTLLGVAKPFTPAGVICASFNAG